ncbi:MAG: BolA family transcriptional regulator [Deltaproteobacteria bacterium]|nr:BolA family transcriptional regulator [Deltaproteobacteria bacterium]
MTATQLKGRIEELAPGTTAELIDLTGTQDHWQAIVVSPAFEGMLMVERHRMVYALLDKEIKSDQVHALTLKTFTPAQYEKTQKA